MQVAAEELKEWFGAFPFSVTSISSHLSWVAALVLEKLLQSHEFH